MKPPTLTDGVVVLDELTVEDAEDLAALDDERAQWAFERGPRSPAGARKLIARTYWQWQRGSPMRRFAVRLPAGGRPVLVGTLIVFRRGMERSSSSSSDPGPGGRR